MSEYKKEIDTILDELLPKMASPLNNIRYLKMLYFVKSYKKTSKVYRWYKRLKGKDQLVVIDNMVAPYFDMETVLGKNPGDIEVRRAKLQELGCPFVK
jgi:hypothetical protein